MLHCRDVKSSNILLTKEGVAKVADVGLASMTDQFSTSRGAGTFTYAAPEILLGEPCSEKVCVHMRPGSSSAEQCMPSVLQLLMVGPHITVPKM